MRKVPSWDEYFMRLAETASIRSKDPNTNVGACIVNERKHVISMGYNGLPPGYPDTVENWTRPKKYFLVIHAEAGAIVNATQSVYGCTIYTTLFPCAECAKILLTAGIRRIIYRDWRDDFAESRTFLLEAGVIIEQLEFKHED